MNNKADGATTHLFYRTIKLLVDGIKPIYVFDGKAPVMKSGELAKRSERRAEAEAKLREAKEAENAEEIGKFSKRLVRVTRQHNEDCKKLLKLLGVPIICAPSEAEAQCAQLAKEGLVYGVATEDMDGLTFGTPRLIRHLSSGNTEKCKEFTLERVLEDNYRSGLVYLLVLRLVSTERLVKPRLVETLGIQGSSFSPISTIPSSSEEAVVLEINFDDLFAAFLLAGLCETDDIDW